MKKVIVIMVSLALVFSFVLVGCSDESAAETSAATSSTTVSESTETEEATTEASAEEEILIGVSLPTQQEERWTREQGYIEEVCEELGATCVVQYADGDSAQQVSDCENLISQGIDVLILCSVDGDSSSTIVEKAHAENIPVVAYERAVQNSDVDYYVTFDNISIGEMLANYIVENVEEGANIVVLHGSPSDSTAIDFKKGSTGILYPLDEEGEINIVYEADVTDWDPEVALSYMEQALTANDNDVDGVMVTNDGSAGAVVQALAAQGMAGTIPVTGQDAELSACQRIVEGTQSMTVFKDMRDLARAAVVGAIALVNDEEPESNTTYDTGLEEVLTEKLDATVVTKDNMDDTIVASGFHTEEEVYGE